MFTFLSLQGPCATRTISHCLCVVHLVMPVEANETNALSSVMNISSSSWQLVFLVTTARGLFLVLDRNRVECSSVTSWWVSDENPPKTASLLLFIVTIIVVRHRSPPLSQLSAQRRTRSMDSLSKAREHQTRILRWTKNQMVWTIVSWFYISCLKHQGSGRSLLGKYLFHVCGSSSSFGSEELRSRSDTHHDWTDKENTRATIVQHQGCHQIVSDKTLPWRVPSKVSTLTLKTKGLSMHRCTGITVDVLNSVLFQTFWMVSWINHTALLRSACWLLCKPPWSTITYLAT